MKTNRYVVGFDGGLLVWGNQLGCGEGAMNSYTLLGAKRMRNKNKDLKAKIYKLVEVKND